MSREVRIKLIEQIEEKRQSHLIVYFLSDRIGAQAQIGEDAVRPLYDHLLAVEGGSPRRNRIDLFLYSRGGGVEVPWRIVSTIREFCDEFAVLIPYKAHSAATMIALGADEIVMGKKGELGPIDPSATVVINEVGGQQRQEQINVEDMMSFISFLRDRANLTDQEAVSNNVSVLAQRLQPWIIGGMYRTHAHMNLVARKLLDTRKIKIEESKANNIIKALVEEIYLHGHAIGRKEARDMGLPVRDPDAEAERLIWDLFLQYEDHMRLSQPIDPRTFIPEEVDEYAEADLITACIESGRLFHVFSGDLRARRVRQPPPQLNINISLNVQLPAGITPQTVPQAIVQEIVRQLQSQISEQVRQQLRSQSPVVRVEGALQNAYWKLVKT